MPFLNTNDVGFRMRAGKTLDGSGHFAGTQAAGAGVNTLRGTVHNCSHAFDIGLPSPVRASVRMGNLYAESNILATNIALCHESAPPSKALVIQQCYIIRFPGEMQAFFCFAADSGQNIPREKDRACNFWAQAL